jgi:hypothetical protein
MVEKEAWKKNEINWILDIWLTLYSLFTSTKVILIEISNTIYAKDTNNSFFSFSFFLSFFLFSFHHIAESSSMYMIEHSRKRNRIKHRLIVDPIVKLNTLNIFLLVICVWHIICVINLKNCNRYKDVEKRLLLRNILHQREREIIRKESSYSNKSVS